MKSKFFVLLAAIALLVAVCAFAHADISTDEIPQLDSLYPGQEVRLKLFSNEEQRVFGYYGPGDKYCSAAGYKPYKQVSVVAYVNEGGWVLVHLTYKTARDRYVYFADNAFESLGQVQSVPEVQYYEGVIAYNTQARMGPSEDFFFADGLKNVPSGTKLKVFFRKDGFAYAEFVKDGKTARLWIPLTDIRITGSGSYIPEQRKLIPSRSSGSGTVAGSTVVSVSYPDHPCWICGGRVKVTTFICYDVRDAQYHHAGTMLEESCESCGYQAFAGGDDVWDEEHTFSDGVCTKCGFVKGSDIECSQCGHSMVPVSYYDAEPYDDHYHLYKKYTCYVCSNCYYQTDSELVSAELDPHYFYDNDVCSFCGYADPGD